MLIMYLYLLSLLICINITFCYEYTSNKEWSNSLKSRKQRGETTHRYRTRNVEERRLRKRHDDDMAYDKDPVALIDVANFIKRPEDESFGNDPYEFQYNNIKHVNNYNDYENLNRINSEEKAYNNDDYSDLNAENLLENPPNLNLDASSIKNKGGKATPGLDHIYSNDLDDESLSKSNTHYQHKKCALRNMKLPFFSHNKSVTTKGKKNNKRKLQNFIKLRKGTVSNDKNYKLSNKNSVDDGQNLHKYYKIDKRSYVEQLCPECKRKFIVKQKLDIKNKRRDILKKYYNTRKIKNDEIYSENVNEVKNTNKVDVDDNNLIADDEVDLKATWRDKRRKREDDNRNIERQKELDELERRVESISVIHPNYNKANSKT